jgi:hypothetical protein
MFDFNYILVSVHLSPLSEIECNCSVPSQLRFANPFQIAFGNGICSHLNQVLTVSAASASTCSEQLQFFCLFAVAKTIALFYTRLHGKATHVFIKIHGNCTSANEGSHFCEAAAFGA